MHLLFFIGIELVHFYTEDPRRIIHRAAHQPCERQDRFMIRRVALAPCVEFITSCGFTGKEMGIGAVQSGRADRLMGIQHDPVFRCSFNHALIMLYHPLTVMMLSPWYDMPNITCFYCIITIPFHKTVSCIHPALIISDGC